MSEKKTLILSLMLSTVLSVKAFADPESGSCGTSDEVCHWELKPMLDNNNNPIYLSDGVTPALKLTVSGTGALTSAPWTSQNNNIVNVVVEDGISLLYGGGAFSRAPNLTSVTIPNSVTQIGYATFFITPSLTSVTIPNSVTDIGQSAFEGASGLTSLTIPSSVTTIGESAFSGTSSLTSLTIPDSVTYIGGYAFRYDSSLTSLVIEGTPSIGGEAFSGMPSTAAVYCLQNVACTDRGLPDDNIIRYRKDSDGVYTILDAQGEPTAYYSSAATMITGGAEKGCSSQESCAKVIALANIPQAQRINLNDGSVKVIDPDGKVHYEGKRIYTLEEANEVVGKTNRFRIRYR